MNVKTDRRTFLKGVALAGAAVAGASFTGCSNPEKSSEKMKWDYETEVLVVGDGSAGLTAAITAYQEGAQVLIVEKSKTGGGTSRVSGGCVPYLKGTEQEVLDLLVAKNHGLTSEDVMKAWIEESKTAIEWLDSLEVPYFDPGYGGADLKGLPNPTSLGMVKILDENPDIPYGEDCGGHVYYQICMNYLSEKGVETLFSTRATDLVQDPETKEIIGIVATQNDGKTSINIKAKKAVILCTGGFDFNDEMMGSYVRPYPVKSCGWPYNTGDGFKMAQAVGADIWHTNIVCSHGPIFCPPDDQYLANYWSTKFGGKRGYRNGSYFFINRTGKRFVAEYPPNRYYGHRSFMEYSTFDTTAVNTMTTTDYRDIPFYCIFDEPERLAGAVMTTGAKGTGEYKTMTYIPEDDGGLPVWSNDNSTEIDKGWILKADTLAELAEKISKETDGYNLTAETLEATFADYQDICATQVDPLGRATEDTALKTPSLVALSETGPYYAVRFFPGIYNTCGGPVKNGKGQILDTKGNVIPRLYEAGVLGHSSAQIYSLLGENWAECIFYGRISGRNAAAETTME